MKSKCSLWAFLDECPIKHVCSKCAAVRLCGAGQELAHDPSLLPYCFFPWCLQGSGLSLFKFTQVHRGGGSLAINTWQYPATSIILKSKAENWNLRESKLRIDSLSISRAFAMSTDHAWWKEMSWAGTLLHFRPFLKAIFKSPQMPFSNGTPCLHSWIMPKL